jgi:hypothetical protein
MRRKTYAVWWQEEPGDRHAGKLELGSLHIHLKTGPDVRIGNLDDVGVLLELSDALAG